jgi:hypothetical protein
MTSMTDSNDPARLISTGSSAASWRTRAGKSLRLGVLVAREAGYQGNLCRGDADAEACFDAGRRLGDPMVFEDSVTSSSRTQARRVFCAGAQSILDILMTGPEATESDVDRVEALSDELRRFAEDVEAGRG